MSEGGFEEILSSVMGNEELMKKISGIANAHSKNTEEALPEVIEAITSSMNVSQESNAKPEENHEKKHDAKRFDYSKSSKLLLALKPYLSDKRCQMIDSILRVEQIAEFMKITR